MNINNKQITEYSINTTQSILSIPRIHIFIYFKEIGIAIYTFGTSRMSF